jgi:hypothetical protein
MKKELRIWVLAIFTLGVASVSEAQQPGKLPTEYRQADRPDDPAQRAGAGAEGDTVKKALGSRQQA